MKTKLLLIFILIIAIVTRFIQLDQNPPSLYWDETSLGYNAFSILTTGHDEHGEKLPLSRFIAYGDYKPPGYIYAIVPFMALFGVNEFAIRFPSALSGVLMVGLTYLIAKELFGRRDNGLVAAFLVAVSPWSLQLSRAAFEGHLAAVFHATAILLFIKSINESQPILKGRFLLPLSFIFFALAIYTFSANRILSPLFIGFLSVIYIRQIWKVKKWWVLGLVLFFVLLIPSIDFFQSRESRLRFHEVSIFTSLDTVKKANARIERSGNSIWSKIVHNRRVYFARDFLSHYFDHFESKFLFIKGDRNPRLSTQDVGELHLFELPLTALGFLTLIFSLKNRKKRSLVILGWLILTPIPAAMARETPHMLRTASIFPVYQLIAGLGAIEFWHWVRKKSSPAKILLIGGFCLLLVSNLFYYFHNYWTHYSKDWASEWQYGYKEMVEKVKNLEGNYDRISVTSTLGRPYIYFLFYNQVNPLEYVANRRAERDWFGLWNVYGYGKYDFVEIPYNSDEKILKVGTEGTFANTGTLLETIYKPDGNVVFEIGEL